MKKNYHLSLLIIVLSAFLPVFCLAYKETKTGDVTVHVSPANPAPGEAVSVSIESLTFDLNSSDITWNLNGKNIADDIGKTSTAFSASDAGNSDVLTTTVKTRGGQTITDTISFAPQNVDVIWQALTFTPPFYRGKALATSESPIKVTAIANFYDGNTQIKPQGLIYKWQYNGNALPFQSGYGKSSITVNGAKLFGNNTFTVSVSDLDNNYFAEKTITVPVSNPRALFYEQKNDEGILFNKALSGQITMFQNTKNLVVEPYFFTQNDLPGLKFRWFVDKVETSNPDNQPTLVFKSANNESFNSAINMVITNSNSLLQQAVGSFNLTRDKR